MIVSIGPRQCRLLHFLTTFKVYGPSSADYDLDVGPVLLTDWYRKDYYTLVAEYVGTDLSILPFTAGTYLADCLEHITAVLI